MRPTSLMDEELDDFDSDERRIAEGMDYYGRRQRRLGEEGSLDSLFDDPVVEAEDEDAELFDE